MLNKLVKCLTSTHLLLYTFTFLAFKADLMSRNSFTFPVSTLQNICIDYVANNLHSLLNQINSISKLPNHVKDKILHKISVSLHYWRKLNVKLIWQSLLHSQTKQVDFTFCSVDDDLLSTLMVCQNLRELYLTQILDNSLTSEGLRAQIPHLKQLRMLTLSKCTAVNDEVVISIARNCPELIGLDLHSCVNITDAALYELSNLENIIWLTLSNTKITDNGIEAFIKGPSSTKLKEFRIGDCINITGKIFPAILSNCPNLEVFVVHGCKLVQDTQLLDLPLRGLKQIQYTIEW